MTDKTGYSITEIIKELDNAVLGGDTKKADALTALLYELQGGTDESAAMPAGFSDQIAGRGRVSEGGQKSMSKGIRKFIYFAAAAVLITALSVTALATDFFGIRDLVIGSYDGNVSAAPAEPGTDAPPSPSPQDLIALQGYPDSSEYKASQEWSAFLAGFDTDHAILNKVGNSHTEFYDKYPMYNIYAQEMADKLEEIIAKYDLTLHQTITIVQTAEELYGTAGTGRFLSETGANAMLGGYVYNDGTFHYDGQAVLTDGTIIGYQLGNYMRGTFSDTYLNVGNADSYRQWTYQTKDGMTVSLALGEGKALVIADLDNSFVTVNVLAGTNPDSQFGSGVITDAQLQAFADLFNFNQINMHQGK